MLNLIWSILISACSILNHVTYFFAAIWTILKFSSSFYNSLILQLFSPHFVICIETCECQLFFRGHNSETCRRTYLSVHCRFIYYEQICVIKKGTNSNGKNEASKMLCLPWKYIMYEFRQNNIENFCKTIWEFFHGK